MNGFLGGWLRQNQPRPAAVPQGFNHAELRSGYWQRLLACTDPLAALVGDKRDPSMAHTIMLGGAEGQLLTTDPDTSVLVLGPPRSTGKTAGVIIPAILTARGPVVTVSTKPDVAIATALHRARQGTVWHFAPDGSPTMPGMRPLRWSPIGGNWNACLERATWMVQAANMSGSSRSNEKFWEIRASDLLAPVLFYAGLRDRDMEWVVQLITGMDLKKDFLPVVEELADWGYSMASKVLRGIIFAEDRMRTSIFATASAVLRPYLLSGAIETTKNPNFDIAKFVVGSPDKKTALIESVEDNRVGFIIDDGDGTNAKVTTEPWQTWVRQSGVFGTIYISASEENMSLVAPLIVGFLGDIQRAIYAQSRADSLASAPRRAPVLWAIDELASVPIPNLPTLLRDAGSQGLLVLGALQSLTQTAKWGDEGKALQTLFNNLVVLPGIRDRETLELLSLLVGEYDREVWTGSYSRGQHNTKEWNEAKHFDRMKRLPPDDIYNGHPYDRDAALVFSKRGWMWTTLQLYYRTPPWPLMVWRSADYAWRVPFIAVAGLPWPDLARGGDVRYLEAFDPRLARRFMRSRDAYFRNMASWQAKLAAAHTEALEIDARRGMVS